ncbi:MAG: hypothetical protein C0434_07275 [Xanthomonadaceae bacterium]|nr:hypothetical protein [Xanthomonadaceae bacterium]
MKPIPNEPPDQEDDSPFERRWVRSDEIATLVKHMQLVIPDAEWQASVGSPNKSGTLPDT